MNMHCSVDELSNSSVRLDVIFFEQGGEYTEFAHFGTPFRVRNESVISLEPCYDGIPNPFHKGEPQTISLRGDAEILPAWTVKASSLLETLPFAVARPSLIPGIQFETDLGDLYEERRWLLEQGISIADETTMTTYTRTDSARSTESKSGGVVDDSSSDSMSNDDANPSD